jgi:hypothetical protein
MTTRSRTNHIVGGKGKAASTNPPRQRKPRPAPALIPCHNCGRRNLPVLAVGDNDITIACDCGAVTKVRVSHDGYGNALIYSGTIEAVEK